MTTTSARGPQLGDVVTVRRGRHGRRQTVEVTDVWPDLGSFAYRVPYASTYTEGGQYENSYRGHGGARLSSIL